MKYLLGSGFYTNDRDRQFKNDFYDLWYNNVKTHIHPGTKIVVIGVDNCIPSFYSDVSFVNLSGNIGACGELIKGIKPHKFTGSSGAILALALIAYCNESDFIWQEQDCLAFGPWIETMYQEIGEAGFIFGKQKVFNTAFGVFLLKHEFILEFVSLYLKTQPENHECSLIENKFWEFLCLYPEKFKQYSFGYDRERPVDFNDKVWYAQHIAGETWDKMKELGFLEKGKY